MDVKKYGVVGLTVLLIFMTAVVLLMRKADTNTSDFIILHNRNMVYSSTTIVTRSGTIPLNLVNDDFVPHSFTIDELNIDFHVHPRGEDYLIFTAPPGTYTFYCTIPGHQEAGMVGQLIVEP